MTSSTMILPPQVAPARASAARRLWVAILRVPLLGKLIGANLLLFASAIVAHEMLPESSSTAQIAIVLLLSLGATSFLVWLALRPIVELEATADVVSSGDYKARVPRSVLADRDTLRLSATMNRLLDRVEADRARIHYLAGRSVRAREIERESVARELRDSFAQTLSAVALQLAAAQRVNKDPEVEQQIERGRTLITQLTEDMRVVAETLHPGMLGELGLVNAMRALARRASRQWSLQIEVDAPADNNLHLSSQAASALYRAADEALRNVAQHAGAQRAIVRLRSTEDQVIVEVEDDGRGVDMRSSDPLQAGLGLFSARAVLALTGGDLHISSAPGLGTHVTARVRTTSPNHP
jgi:two-component system sensor histidine kinase UhpB